MAYFVTAGLGLELADPLTIQAFDTVNVNSNFQLLEGGIVADRVRLTASETYRNTTATATTLAAIVSASTNSLRTVLSNGSEWRWDGTMHRLFSVPKVANAAARDALYVAPVVPQAGDTVFLTDRGYPQRYDGTVWRGVPGSVISRWVLSGTTTKDSLATALADFETVDLIIEETAGSNSDTQVLLRVAAADIVTGYSAQSTYSTGATATSVAGGTALWGLTAAGGTDQQITVRLRALGQAKAKRGTVHSSGSSGYMLVGGLGSSSTSVIDGLKIQHADLGAITGIATLVGVA